LNEQSSILIRVRELLSAADCSLGDFERGTLQLETNSLRIENLTAASANIKNRNVAEEITELTKQ
jgi:hypothetical protein